MPKKNAIIEINQNWCKSCVICVEVCPRDVLEMNGVYPHVKALDKCTACALCEVLCPDFAIVIDTVEEEATT